MTHSPCVLRLWRFAAALFLFFPLLAGFAPYRQTDPARQAEALCQAGDDAYAQEDYPTALDQYRQCLAIYEQYGPRVKEAEALFDVGDAFLMVDQGPAALETLLKSEELFRSLGAHDYDVDLALDIGWANYLLRNYDEARRRYRQAAALARQNHDIDSENAADRYTGLLLLDEKKYQQALDTFLKLQDRYTQSDQPPPAELLENIGQALYYLSRYPEALDYFQKTLEQAEKENDLAMQRTAWNDRALILANRMQVSEAIDAYQHSLAISRQAHMTEYEALALVNLALVYQSAGDLESAMSSAQEGLQIYTGLGSDAGRASALSEIASINNAQGDYQKALDLYFQARDLFDRLGMQDKTAETLESIADVYFVTGHDDLILENLTQALQIRRSLGQQIEVAHLLTALGRYHRDHDDLNAASQELSEAAEILLNNKADPLSFTQTILELSQVLLALDKPEDALAACSLALDTYKNAGAENFASSAYNTCGEIYEQMEKYSEARQSYERALAIDQRLGDSYGIFVGFSHLALLDLKEGKKDSALANTLKAEELAEAAQANLHVEELKSNFLGQDLVMYETIVNLLYDKGDMRGAFLYSEKARARAFLDQLNSGAVDFRQGLDQELLSREQDLRARIQALRGQYTRLALLSGDPQVKESMRETRQELNGAEKQYSDLLIEMKTRSPQLASVTGMQVLPVEEVQKHIPEQTVLVEYYLTYEKSYAFILTRSEFHMVRLEPGRYDVQYAVEAVRDLSHPGSEPAEDWQQLSRWLLDPIQPYLTRPVVGIIPHLSLHYLPFSALPTAGGYFGDHTLLFELPSASALPFFEQQKKATGGDVLALGNPSTEAGLGALPFAEQEVDQIASLYQTSPLVGSAASETAFREHAGGFSILHLAAHGVFNAASPQFSAIHLSPDEQNDGRLELNEIYGIDLSQKTSLVVLSACDTQVGKTTGGDELVALSRAFLYAGAPSVIASLWSVEDDSTAYLMGQFYTHLKAGLSKSQALQQAQIDTRGKYPDPHDWSGFILIGDPGVAGGPLPETGPASPRPRVLRPLLLLGLPMLIGGAALLAGGAFLFLRRRASRRH